MASPGPSLPALCRRNCRLVLPVNGLRPAEDLGLLQLVGHGVHRVLHRPGQQLQAGAGGGLLWGGERVERTFNWGSVFLGWT